MGILYITFPHSGYVSLPPNIIKRKIGLVQSEVDGRKHILQLTDEGKEIADQLIEVKISLHSDDIDLTSEIPS